jgi:hypothetical protein
MTDETFIDALAAGKERVGDLVRHVRADLDRHLARTGRAPNRPSTTASTS